MNYQLLLECFSEGTEINDLEAELLELELYSQIENIKLSSYQGSLEIAPVHICEVCLVPKGSLWITCLAALLDKLIPCTKGTPARYETVLNELNNGYVATN